MFRRLLVKNKTSADGKNEEEEQEWNSFLNTEEWNSLLDLQTFWKPHRLVISLSTLTHKAKMSDDIIAHEVATVSLEGAQNAIDMRLRCDLARNTCRTLSKYACLGMRKWVTVMLNC